MIKILAAAAGMSAGAVHDIPGRLRSSDRKYKIGGATDGGDGWEMALRFFRIDMPNEWVVLENLKYILTLIDVLCIV